MDTPTVYVCASLRVFLLKSLTMLTTAQIKLKSYTSWKYYSFTWGGHTQCLHACFNTLLPVLALKRFANNRGCSQCETYVGDFGRQMCRDKNSAFNGVNKYSSRVWRKGAKMQGIESALCMSWKASTYATLICISSERSSLGKDEISYLQIQ